MSWKCFDCFRNQVEDVHLLDYQHFMLYDVPIEVFTYERTLEELKLDSNRIRDLPRPLFHCHGLKILSLSDNDIQTLPPAVASLINLQQLDLSKNALSAIPDNIKCCKQLHCVDVSINPLEKLPEGFTQLINLEELYLNDTYLEFLPANFGRLTRLKILELRENNLNTLPKSIARLSKLERLDLGQNEFTDVPEAIGSLTNLTELWVDCNRIKSISSVIGNLKNLVHFDASSNNINGISSLIEKCEKLVDLTLSCNELQEISSSIGNLKELVTLKLDDNHLRIIPSSIGNLSLLQELILSHNNLESLPSTVGLLRQLHILNVDDNILEDLPPEIGSCSSLTLLSVRNNKLQDVPAELGHLQRIKVINLSDNLLQNLPVSILKLTHLNALWLSNNQSTPLPILQKEFDRDTGQTVCVNFMLPQTPQLQDFAAGGQYTEPDEAPTRSRPLIRFAVEAQDEEPNHLLRAPTPYPKELRAMAKHARALHQGPKRAYKDAIEDAPLLGKLRTPWPGDVLIKEAKVKKPETFSLCEQSKPALFPALSVSESIQETSLHSAENRPIIREAKYVRQRTSTAYSNGNKLCDESLQQNQSSMPSCSTGDNLRFSIASSSDHPLQPPPYHIAAAYSKQAKWFGHFNPHIKTEKSTNMQCADIAAASSSKNGSSFHSAAVKTVGSDNVDSGLLQPNGEVFNGKSQCINNTLIRTCSEDDMHVKNEVDISLHVDDCGSSHKNDQLRTEIHSSQVSSKWFIDNLQTPQYEESVKSLGSDCRTTHVNSKENVLSSNADLNVMQQVPCLGEEAVCSSSLNKGMNGTICCSKDDVNSSVEKYSDCVITQLSSHFVPTSTDAETENESSSFLSSENKNSSYCVNSPEIVSDIINNITTYRPIETSPEEPSVFPMYDKEYSEHHNFRHVNGQFLDTIALTNNEALAYECSRQVPYNSDILSRNTKVSKRDIKIEQSDSIKSPCIENFEPSYQPNSTVTALTPVLKNTKVSPSTSASRKSSNLWRFGLHRNPTVFPVLIQKNEDIGFNINGNVETSLLTENQV
ncbi:protein lap1 isoform X2 [Bacillus rossius redtenbacheri]|uniref:protein lap1 isoform X2 n=1 Tax=Bacillus rossius redtenbacheri TaxID=93214 RepID=UPI002FDEBACB